MIPSTAWSSGASAKTMFAALPPSSSVRRLPVPASDFWMRFPTSVEPVKATFRTPGCVTSAAPVAPAPVITFTTPGGRSASSKRRARWSAVRGVVSAGLRIDTFPHARAGAIFQAAIRSGKFHGMTCPQTPIGLALRPGSA